jgi:hypothetical protein
MALGELIGEGSGKTTGQRVLNVEGPKMMAGLGDALTQLGVSANELKQNLPID